MDPDYRMQQAGFELVRRRDKFYEAGGDPMSPECPDIIDILKDWGFNPFEQPRKMCHVDLKSTRMTGRGEEHF